MKAIICDGYRSFEKLQIKEIDKPKIKKDEVLIKVMASTVASGDCVVRNAKNPFVRIVFGLRKPRNPILGTDLSGIIEAVGDDVTTFNIGDRVIASTGMKFGCHAEYIALKKDQPIVKMSHSLSYNDAVTLCFGGLAALNYLKKIKCNSNKSILIYGASGAVGSSMVQLAKHCGFSVDAVCSANNKNLVKELGADKIFDYKKTNWKNELKQYDYIFDAVGKTSKSDWKDHLKLLGEFYSIAKGLVKENAKDMKLLVQLAAEKKIMPVIDKVYSMDQIVEAYIYVETGRKRGNVVLDFSNSKT